VEKYGEPSQEWLVEAREQQRIAEAWVKPAEQLENTMPPAKVAATPAAKATAAKLMFPKESFVLYRESAKPAVKMMTDSYTMERGEYKGKPVWILPNGMRFDMDEAGEPKNLITG